MGNRDWEAEIAQIRSAEAALSAQAFNAALIANGAGVATLVAFAGNLEDPDFALKALVPTLGVFGIGLGLAFASIWAQLASVRVQRTIWERGANSNAKFGALAAKYDEFKVDLAVSAALSFPQRRERARQLEILASLLSKSVDPVKEATEEAHRAIDKNGKWLILLTAAAALLNGSSLSLFIVGSTNLYIDISSGNIKLERAAPDVSRPSIQSKVEPNKMLSAPTGAESKNAEGSSPPN